MTKLNILLLLSLMTFSPMKAFAGGCETADNFARFIEANRVLKGLVERYKGDPVAGELSRVFEAGLRQLFEMKTIPAPESATRIHHDGRLVTIDFNLKEGESGVIGRATFFFNEQVLRVTVPTIKSHTPGDTYFPKFISGFYEGIYRVIKEYQGPIKDIQIVGGMVVNKKLKQRLPKLGFKKGQMTYSIMISDYAE